ncbi:MAG: hypothetical protein V4772_00690 [Pseudomonadota bacterium]
MDTALKEDVPVKDLVPQMTAELVPAWRALEQRWNAYRVNPAMPGAPVLAAMKQYVQSRRAFLEATLAGWETGDAAAFIEASKHKAMLEDARLLMVSRPDTKSGPKTTKP